MQISAENVQIPVIIHNLKGYDSHLIMQDIGQIIKDENRKIAEENIILAEKDQKLMPKLDLKVIAQNAEKYMAIYLGKRIVFLDSFQFMSSSLCKLADNLPEDKFIYTSEYFSDERQFQLMKRKGVYPYDYMDSFSKFSDKKLPQKEDFYSLLNAEDISDDDYQHAKDVWKTFNISNMGEYHDLYLKTDVLLLADVFENFRVACLENYKLDPAHYITTPGLAWDAMLKMTSINLELINDIDMHLFIEKGKRGGISYIANRYMKANNPYMKCYNQEDDTTYIIYLDANNLYGWAMIQPLPYGGFQWVEPKFYDKKVDGIGYIYEVDLAYPSELHHLHNDYPLAPQK